MPSVPTSTTRFFRTPGPFIVNSRDRTFQRYTEAELEIGPIASTPSANIDIVFGGPLVGFIDVTGFDDGYDPDISEGETIESIKTPLVPVEGDNVKDGTLYAVNLDNYYKEYCAYSGSEDTDDEDEEVCTEVRMLLKEPIDEASQRQMLEHRATSSEEENLVRNSSDDRFDMEEERRATSRSSEMSRFVE